MTDKQVHFIIQNYLFVNLPIAICLVLKMLYGLRWIKLKMTYPALCSFYLISCTFYTSFIVAESLIIFAGFDSFTNLYVAYVVVTDILCILFWVALYFHVNQSEKNNIKMNDYRKDAIKRKISVAQRQEEDRQLIESHRRMS